MAAIISIILAYLIGSISVAIILARILKYPDPRTMGSGNAGATNVLRMVGKKEAIIVFIGDGLKGLIAVLIGRMLGVEGFALGLVALAAVIGHIFPLYFQFKGGRGVATAVGTTLGLSFFVGILVLIIWGLLIYLTRYSSLASLCAVCATPIFLLFSHAGYFIPTLIIAGLILWKHKDNILRLRSGTESKVNF